MSSTASERILRARLASHEKWAACPDRSAATAPARRAFDERFEREVDPDGVLTPDERACRAQHARKAFYTRLALKSVQSRRRAAALTAEAEKAEAELSAPEGVTAA